MTSRTEDTVSSATVRSAPSPAAVIWLARQAGAIIRPASPADMAALGDFFAGLSARTRYLRFLCPGTPNALFEPESSSGTRCQRTGPEPKARDAPGESRTPRSRQ